jgi:hypothetical protein
MAVVGEERARRLSEARAARSDDYRRAQLAAASAAAGEKQRRLLQVGAGSGSGPACAVLAPRAWLPL